MGKNAEKKLYRGKARRWIKWSNRDLERMLENIHAVLFLAPMISFQEKIVASKAISPFFDISYIHFQSQTGGLSSLSFWEVYHFSVVMIV